MTDDEARLMQRSAWAARRIQAFLNGSGGVLRRDDLEALVAVQRLAWASRYEAPAEEPPTVTCADCGAELSVLHVCGLPSERGKRYSIEAREES